MEPKSRLRICQERYILHKAEITHKMVWRFRRVRRVTKASALVAAVVLMLWIVGAAVRRRNHPHPDQCFLQAWPPTHPVNLPPSTCPGARTAPPIDLVLAWSGPSLPRAGKGRRDSVRDRDNVRVRLV